MKNYARKILREEKGSAMVELIASIMLLLVLFSGLILSCVYVSKYFGCVYAVRSTVRTIEGVGMVEDSVRDNLLLELNNSGLENVSLDIASNFYEGNKIQLRDTFIVNVSADYPFKLFTFSDNEISLKLPIQVSLQGRSEVYWKQ